MINREDMLELTRRMTPARASVQRIAGAYLDCDGFVDGTFNIHFLKLKMKEKEENLAIAKAIPFAKTNENLTEVRFREENQENGSMWHLLMALRDCGLKNDALMDIFYERIAEHYKNQGDYGILLFYGVYDIPRKGADHASQWESEEVYEYLICAICPLVGEYEPGKPDCGFLFPAYSDRCGDLNCVDVYQADTTHPHMELVRDILGC